MGWFFSERKSMEKTLESLSSNLSRSFGNLKKDIKNAGDWIIHFKNKEVEHDQRLNVNYERLNALEQRLNALKSEIGLLEASGDRIIEPVERAIEHVQSFNRSDQAFMNVQKNNKLSDLGVLTPAQKQVIGLMAYAGGPLGYEEISKKLGLNVVTARRHINDILRAGIKLNQKVSVKNRRKMFELEETLREEVIGKEK